MVTHKSLPLEMSVKLPDSKEFVNKFEKMQVGKYYNGILISFHFHKSNMELNCIEFLVCA